eukprot:scaffold17294_cov135-Isochrysis_galbana.AAC.3
MHGRCVWCGMGRTLRTRRLEGAYTRERQVRIGLYVKKKFTDIRVARAPHPHQSLPDSLTRFRLLYSHFPQTPLPTNPFGKVSWGGMPPTLLS